MRSFIYTCLGDSGETSLGNGQRLAKDAPRVEALGSLDETVSWIGLARALVTDDFLNQALEFLQHRLYNCTSILASVAGSNCPSPPISSSDVIFLEQAIDRFESYSGSLKGFILPGGCMLAGMLHVARSVCRRAERRLVTLNANELVDPLLLKFVNRSSDFLFAAARYVNALEHVTEGLWNKLISPP